MTKEEMRLLDMLNERSFAKGTFQLSSGGTSNYYIDVCMTSLVAAGLIGEVIWKRLEDVAFDTIGGPAEGAIPLVAAVCAVSRCNPDGFWVKNKAKDHEPDKLIEGRIDEGARVVIVDDVATKGNSLVRCIDVVRAHGGTVVAVVVLVDRLEGAEEMVRSRGVSQYLSIFTIRDFGIDC